MLCLALIAGAAARSLARFSSGWIKAAHRTLALLPITSADACLISASYWLKRQTGDSGCQLEHPQEAWPTPTATRPPCPVMAPLATSLRCPFAFPRPRLPILSYTVINFTHLKRK
uniref:Putative secreted protein n=1 Tax=Amblyomma americanum TaxID=6943 RepID=A0A0C9S3V9_AMBAM